MRRCILLFVFIFIFYNFVFPVNFGREGKDKKMREIKIFPRNFPLGETRKWAEPCWLIIRLKREEEEKEKKKKKVSLGSESRRSFKI